MSKPLDFSGDLSQVSDGVVDGVNDILRELKQKRESPTKSVDITVPDSSGESGTAYSEASTTSGTHNSSGLSRPRKSRPLTRSPMTVTVNQRLAKERFTTRVTSDTKAKLEEAKNWQKVKRLIPDNYEDILEEALTDWFRKMRYTE